MKLVAGRPRLLKPKKYHYCSGCGHSIVHNLLLELFDELGIAERVIGVAPAGCAVLAYDYMDVDIVESAHGRGPAVATGIKRSLPNAFVFNYQGDGDLAAIGTAESIHAAARGERIMTIFINNGIYGMTGGQMAPTTLLGMRASTAPEGRSPNREGHTLDLSALIAQIPGVVYAQRVSVNSPKAIRQCKKALETAIRCQLDGEPGLALIEVLSMCPTNWRKTPVESCSWIDEVMSKTFPIGVLADRRKNAKKTGNPDAD
jgi:2-oxoglutarate/2-oxoacid ferredoxin oxidoreductase subunit beta